MDERSVCFTFLVGLLDWSELIIKKLSMSNQTCYNLNVGLLLSLKIDTLYY